MYFVGRPCLRRLASQAFLVRAEKGTSVQDLDGVGDAVEVGGTEAGGSAEVGNAVPGFDIDEFVLQIGVATSAAAIELT